MRPNDFVGRYGGEELLIVRPTSDVDGLMCLAEPVRKTIESNPVHTDSGEISVPASWGVAASADVKPLDPRDLLRLADDALYRAKQRGRNRCELGGEDEITARPFTPTAVALSPAEENSVTR